LCRLPIDRVVGNRRRADSADQTELRHAT
jgi:hypothetical protein